MRRILLAMATILLISGPGGTTRADPPRDRVFPFDDFSKFLQQFLGEETEEDRQALERVEVTWREEQQVGQAAFRWFVADLKRRGIRLHERGGDVDYLRKLVSLLQPAMRHADRYRKIRVYVADSANTEARCFPGGIVVFSRGMLDFAENEAALVAVVGHELSHLDHGHQLRFLRRMKLARENTARAVQRFDLQQLLQSTSMISRLFNRPFRPEDETQADQDGVTWAFRAGYDPREMAALLLKMHRRDGRRGNGLPAFLRTHPFHADRYRAVLSLYDELQRDEPKTRLYIGKANLKRRVTRAEQEFPD